MFRAAKPQLLVVSTLHKYHADVPDFGYGTLRCILEQLSPDDLLIEVAESDLSSRADEGIKREYPEAVYPFLHDAPAVRAHALEPSGAKREALIQMYVSGATQFQASPEYPAFESYARDWLDQLLSRYQTAVEFNSGEADETVRLKQEYQSTLYPREYTDAWVQWNEHFHGRIVEIVNEWTPRLAVVLVGLEHSYWLRRRLAGRSDMQLLDAHEVLGNLSDVDMA